VRERERDRERERKTLALEKKNRYCRTDVRDWCMAIASSRCGGGEGGERERKKKRERERETVALEEKTG